MSGEGSVFRRASDGAWIAQVSTGPRGHRRYVSRSGRTRAEAVRKLADLRSVNGRSTPKPMSVGDFLERWVSDARNIRPTTRSGYRTVLTHHLEPMIGHILIADLTPLDVEEMLAKTGTTVSPKYLRNIHAVLRRGLGQAVRSGLVTRNVASREFVDAPHVDVDDPAVLSGAELDRIVAVDGPLRSLVIVAADTGLRQGELLGLRWQDIADGSVSVHQELTYRDGRWQPGPPKTPRSRRVVPMTPRAVEALARQRHDVIAAGYVPVSSGPVFVSRAGVALSGSWVTHRFYGICEAAGVDRKPFKILRATYSSRLFAAGVPDRTIADLMGHTRTATTHRHYIASQPDQLVTAVARLNQSPNQSRASGTES